MPTNGIQRLNGNIPDEDLIFFLTPDEIETLAHSRAPKIIFKFV